ncbi:toll/interleukin-1 receptor domain-containing protein [Janthinobacterium sp. SUN120]|uniref:toll/interleukin-1 receptor domain-containing protein n=1 Tax=Janthinobacterium sp. SUN120 TaxID=3004099 RepID=UPI0025B14487|nr:toll/interleukin-1 receptor domain-containing protein [Janthinobacterium sp. SUN120]MDN2714395.1 toll/interleukin-1 receptor domain-containing protein [Janthinobacterium sp. SUN120]
MIVILFDFNATSVANEISANLLNTFYKNITIEMVDAASAKLWPSVASWDDLLLVVYQGGNFPAEGNQFIEKFIAERGDKALILPVAVDLSAPQPPQAAAMIKALPYDIAAKGIDGRLVSRTGGMLGLRLQARESKIFISYRAVDGSKIAKQLHSHLESLGYIPWLDEAIELDGHTAILPGSPVQAQIDSALETASLVLLLDTPSAPQSIWIRHEVDTADAMLVPILPVCFRNADDSKIGPRFRSLVALQRWISMPNPSMSLDLPLSLNQLDDIVQEVEKYLCEIFRRKCRVPFIVENEFVAKGYEWSVRDKAHLMFESSKSGGRVRTRIISHCSIFDQIYGPAITHFRRFVDTAGSLNYSLFIYDGDLLTRIELEDVVDDHDGKVIVLHHQELSSLIASNFSNLGSV